MLGSTYPRVVLNYSFAVGSTAGATLLGLWLRYTFDVPNPTAFYLLATLGTAFVAGAIPALLATALSLFVADYFFASEPYAVGLGGSDEDWTGLAVILGVSVAGIYLVHKLRQQRVRAQEAAENLFALESVSEAALSSLDSAQLLKALAMRIGAVAGAEMGMILTLDEPAGILRLAAFSGAGQDLPPGLELPLGEGLAGRVVATAAPAVVPDVAAESLVGDPLAKLGAKSIIGVPLLAAGRVLGVVQIGTCHAHHFHSLEVRRLEAVAARTALAIERARLFEEVRVERALLDAIFSAMAEGVVVHDAAGTIVRINPAVEKRLRLTSLPIDRADLIDRIALRHHDGSPLNEDDLPSQRALQGESVLAQLLTFTDHHGRDRVSAVSAVPLRRGDEIVGAVSVWHDVTARERMLAEAQQQRELLDALITALPSAIAIVKMPGYIVELVNPTFVQIHGEHEYLGRPATTSLSELKMPGLLETIDRVCLSGETYAEIDIPVKLVRDGQPQDTYWNLTLLPLRDGGSTVQRVVFIGMETTHEVEARQRLEQQARLIKEAGDRLAAQHDRLQALIDQLPEAVVYAEPDGIVFANAAVEEIVGRSRQEFRGHDLRHTAFSFQNAQGETIAPDDLPLQRALEGEVTDGQQITILCPDGSRVTVLANATPVCDSSGRAVGAICVFQDIQKLKDVEKLKEDFVQLMTHDLKGPLTVILGNTQLLQRKLSLADNPQHAHLLERIAAQSQRLNQMVTSMLDLFALESGRLRLDKGALSLPEVAAAVIDRLSPVGDDQRLWLDAAPDLPLVQGDRLRLDQVFTNLVTNAVKYSPAGTPVHITIRPAGPEEQPRLAALLPRHRVPSEAWLVVEVSDQGDGLTPEDLTHVFDRFYRSAARQSHSIEGSGLGLYAARLLVEAHGGCIWATSDGPGKGSTFTFALPL